MSLDKNTILALTYSDGIAADRMIADLGYGFRAAGLSVVGLVQRNLFVRDRAKCDMELEELNSGILLRISEFRGNGAKGCRLDRDKLLSALQLVKVGLSQGPDLIILNKFGKTEAEGGGLRPVMVESAQLQIPTLVGVPLRNLDSWRAFVGGLADECPAGSPEVSRWLELRGIRNVRPARKPVLALHPPAGR